MKLSERTKDVITWLIVASWLGIAGAFALGWKGPFK